VRKERVSQDDKAKGQWLRAKGWFGSGAMPREIVQLQCGDCKERNYSTTKNRKTTTERLEMKKFCRRCRKHTPHKEVK
jgi:large subunit ribosomal protein L33